MALNKVVALISVLFGVGGFVAANVAGGDFFQPLVQGCTQKAPIVTGYAVADFPLCIAIPFFKDLLAPTNHGGLLLTGALFTLMLTAFLVTVVESGRPYASRKLATLFGNIFTVGQLMGIGFAFPIFWLPGVILSAGKLKTEEKKSQAAIPPPQSKLFLSFLFVTFLLAQSILTFLYPQSSSTWTQLNILFQVIYVFALPIYWIANASPSEQARGPVVEQRHAAVAAAYAFVGGVGFIAYQVFMWRFIHTVFLENPTFTASFFTKFTVDKLVALLEQNFWKNATKFIVFDFAGLLGTFFLFIAWDGGFGKALHFLLTSPIVSPGTALAFYFYSREQRLAQRTKVVAAKKTS